MLRFLLGVGYSIALGVSGSFVLPHELWDYNNMSLIEKEKGNGCTGDLFAPGDDGLGHRGTGELTPYQLVANRLKEARRMCGTYERAITVPFRTQLVQTTVWYQDNEKKADEKGNKGHTDDHQLVVFFHGLGCSKYDFVGALKHLPTSKFSFLALDWPAISDADKEELDFGDLIEYAHEVIKAVLLHGSTLFVVKPYALISHSMGAKIATLYAEKYEHEVSHLVNIEGHLHPDDPRMAQTRVDEWESYRGKLQFAQQIIEDDLHNFNLHNDKAKVQEKETAGVVPSEATRLQASQIADMLLKQKFTSVKENEIFGIMKRISQKLSEKKQNMVPRLRDALRNDVDEIANQLVYKQFLDGLSVAGDQLAIQKWFQGMISGVSAKTFLSYIKAIVKSQHDSDVWESFLQIAKRSNSADSLGSAIGNVEPCDSSNPNSRMKTLYLYGARTKPKLGTTLKLCAEHGIPAVETPHSGHFPFFDNPEVFWPQISNFLAPPVAENLAEMGNEPEFPIQSGRDVPRTNSGDSSAIALSGANKLEVLHKGDLEENATALLDAWICGFQRTTTLFFGRIVSNPRNLPHFKDWLGYSMTYNRVPYNNGNALHKHNSVEIFVALDGPFEIGYASEIIESGEPKLKYRNEIIDGEPTSKPTFSLDSNASMMSLATAPSLNFLASPVKKDRALSSDLDAIPEISGEKASSSATSTDLEEDSTTNLQEDIPDATEKTRGSRSTVFDRQAFTDSLNELHKSCHGAVLQPFDLVACPAGVYHYYKNVDPLKRDRQILTILPGMPTVHWAPQVVHSARNRGAECDDTGVLTLKGGGKPMHAPAYKEKLFGEGDINPYVRRYEEFVDKCGPALHLDDPESGGWINLRYNDLKTPMVISTEDDDVLVIVLKGSVEINGEILEFNQTLIDLEMMKLSSNGERFKFTKISPEATLLIVRSKLPHTFDFFFDPHKTLAGRN